MHCIPVWSLRFTNDISPCLHTHFKASPRPTSKLKPRWQNQVFLKNLGHPSAPNPRRLQGVLNWVPGIYLYSWPKVLPCTYANQGPSFSVAWCTCTYAMQSMSLKLKSFIAVVSINTGIVYWFATETGTIFSSLDAIVVDISQHVT